MFLKNNVFKFDLFSSYPDLVHGISTRSFGSMRPKHEEYKDSMQKFARTLEISVEKIVIMGQMHTNNVKLVSAKDRGQSIPQTDSLIAVEKNIFLGAVTADCVPLLIYDPKQKFTSVIHAGWRGLFDEIIKETVLALVAKGSTPQDLLVGIGPCIGVCCYDITPDHRDLLIEKFPDWQQFIVKRDQKLFLDLPGITIHQLINLGIPVRNIEGGNYCTFDHADVYSRRKEGDDFGEIMSLIGVKS